jgi:outer membrane protein assembly factor BamB
MRTVTAAVLVVVSVALGAVVIYGLGFTSSGGQLGETWTSDTARETQFNHHAVGVGPDGDVVVAPVAELGGSGVEMADTTCALVRLGPENGSSLWENGVPAEDCFTHALTEPEIADIDGDGTLEVAASTTENALVVFDARSGDEQFRVPLSSYGYGRPTAADILPAPGTELFTSDINGDAVAVTANGSVAWRLNLSTAVDGSASVWDRPFVRDVDADDTREVVFPSKSGLVVLAPDGDREWVRSDGAVYAAVGQADSDAALELFVSDRGTLTAVDGGTGEPEWTREFRGSARIRTVADTGAGPTLFVGRSNGKTLALDAKTGEQRWSTTVSTGEESVVSPPVVGDVDGDDSGETVAVTRAGSVSVLDPGNGSELARYERSVPIYTFPTLVDTDDDGSDEVLVRYGDGRVVALQYS